MQLISILGFLQYFEIEGLISFLKKFILQGGSVSFEMNTLKFGSLEVCVFKHIFIVYFEEK